MAAEEALGAVSEVAWDCWLGETPAQKEQRGVSLKVGVAEIPMMPRDKTHKIHFLLNEKCIATSFMVKKGKPG